MRFIKGLIIACTASLAVGAPVKRAKKFQFWGVNSSGAEFGKQNLPGKLGTDYTWPNTASLDQLLANGMNTIRINFQQERLVPNKLTGSLDQAYFNDLKRTVEHITNKGAYAIIEPHNFGRYYNNIITDTNAFGAFWKTVATAFKSNSRVIFDTNNEYHDMDQNLVVNLNQAAINGIRAAGATSQYITVEGNGYSGAWNWVSPSQNGATMGALKDPQNKLLFQMHQYLDSDSSGTSPNCVSTTIGRERIAAATKWLRDNRKQGLLGEYAGGNNDQCKQAVRGMLQYMNENADVWKGALWWSAGPWWADYMFNMEPTNGIAWKNYLSVISPYQ